MDTQKQTIEDFGQQWTKYTSNDGFYGSLELFQDMISPLLTIDEIKGARVAEIGSGTGRIVEMLLAAGVSHVAAIEPSDAFYVLRENLRSKQDRVSFHHTAGDQLPDCGGLDYVFSIGVLHHIPNPVPTVKAAYHSLKPGGRFVIWLYGREGNRLYLAIFNLIRHVTKHLPHAMLAALVWLIYWPLSLYIQVSKYVPLPLRRYMTEVIGKMSPEKRRLVIYDQLNPAYAKYYTREESQRLLFDAGFIDVKLHHRHGYSWTVIGKRPVSG